MRKSELKKKLVKSQEIVATAEEYYKTALSEWKAAKKEQNKINRSGESTREIENVVRVTNDTMFYCLRKIKDAKKDIEWYEFKLKE